MIQQTKLTRINEYEFNLLKDIEQPDGTYILLYMDDDGYTCYYHVSAGGYVINEGQAD
jgi:hypothetical protein